MTFSTLRALHAVIGAAIDDIERVYCERAPQGSPLEYPSLDEPYYHTAQHTTEEELAEALKDDTVVVSASMRIVAACGQLAITVNKPWHGLMENLLRGQFSSAIRFLEAANIVEILHDAGSGGLHVREIHRQIFELRTNVKTEGTVPLTPDHLSHILRLLATGHYLREVEPDVFANNRVSSYIDSGKTVPQLREAGNECHLKLMTCLTEWALPEKRSTIRPNVNFADLVPPPEATDQSQAAAAAEPESPLAVAPFNLAFDTQLGLFAWLELPENENRLARFAHAMKGTRRREIKDQILRAFSWEELPQDLVLVDVGGGIGAQSIVVADAHPHVRVVVEDKEHVVSTAVSAWGPHGRYAPLFASGRVSWRARDFFAAWPPLAGVPPRSRFYRYRYRRTSCVPPAFNPAQLEERRLQEVSKILTRLRAAAGLHTTLLIGDMPVQHACNNADADADEAPGAYAYGQSANFNFVTGSGAAIPFVTRGSPLLPNLGVAHISAYLAAGRHGACRSALVRDLSHQRRGGGRESDSVNDAGAQMMCMLGGKERTGDEMAALLLATGWRVVRVARTPGSMWGYTTAVPVC